MTYFYQKLLAVLAIVLAVLILIFGIASVAVAVSFVLIPAGIYFFVRGVHNLLQNSKTTLRFENNQINEITIHPLIEILLGLLMFLAGVKLSESFLGIVLVGIVLYGIVAALDASANKNKN